MLWGVLVSECFSFFLFVWVLVGFFVLCLFLYLLLLSVGFLEKERV